MDAFGHPDDATIEAQLTQYAATRDRGLRNEVIENCRWLAAACSRRYAHRGEPLDDLEQVAVIGLLKAVERFDPQLGVPFRAFATPTILGELRRHFRDRTWRIRVPRRYQELRLHMAAAVEQLTAALQRSPTIAEVASYLKVSEEDVLLAMDAAANYRPLSLMPAGDDSADLIDDGALISTGADEVERSSDRLAAVQLLRCLPPRERRIMYLRYYEGMTQSEIADELGLSQVHVSRLLRLALKTMGQPSAREEH